MIRFAWLQFRMQAAVAAGALAVVAVVLVLTGPGLVHLYDTTVANCAAHHDCSTATTDFTGTDGPLQVFLDFLLLVVPLLIGMFWGAPLVSREFEAGTFRLAWTQGVTRTRWLAVKLGLGAVASAAIAGLLSLMVSWWSSQLDYVSSDPFNSLRFGVRDVVPIGYATLAFTLGLTAGLLFRRMLPAMLAALVGFAAAREVVTAWVRPHLFTPLHQSLPITSATPVSIDQTSPGMVKAFESTRGISIPDAWVYSVKIVNRRPYPHDIFSQPSVSPRQLWSTESPGLHRHARRQVPPAGDLPASQPLLAHAVVRTGDLPRPVHRARRLLLLVDTPARQLTGVSGSSNWCPLSASPGAGASPT